MRSEELQDLEIESLAFGGDGVARTDDGEVVFVRNACPGDVVRARVTADKGRFLSAEISEIVRASPGRVEPSCRYFGTCGGCQWQHVSSELQLSAKRREVADALQRIGHLDPDIVRDTMPSPSVYGYRNKVELVVARDGDLSLGYTASGSETHVPVDECLLLPDRWRAAPRALTGALRYLAGRTDLKVARVALRASSLTGETEVALWCPPGPFPRRAAAGTLADAVDATGVTRVLVKGNVKERRVTRVEVLAGKGSWRERLRGHRMLVSSPSFFQVNTAAAESLVALVTRSLAATKSDRVLDAYAGVGTFTLALAPEVGSVTAIEASAYALKDLSRNLEHAHIDAEIARGDVEHMLPRLGTFDFAVVDPPRAGLQRSVVQTLAASGPSRIVYVSCDPSTLARDGARLAEVGYRAISATPVDLFPQTYHVETVAVFERS